jgi:hypothetical protein
VHVVKARFWRAAENFRPLELVLGVERPVEQEQSLTESVVAIPADQMPERPSSRACATACRASVCAACGCRASHSSSASSAWA